MFAMVELLVDGHGAALHALPGSFYRRTDHNRIEKSYFLSDNQFVLGYRAKSNSLIICDLSGLPQK